MSDYPEHEKLAAVSKHSQVIGEFLDFGLPSMGIHLCEVDEETDRWFPAHRTITSMLAEYSRSTRTGWSRRSGRCWTRCER